MAKNQVIVSITGQTKGLTGALGDAESGLSKFGKVAGAVAIAAGVAVAAMGVKAVKSASELEQAMGGLGAVFGSNVGQMEQWANGAASSVGLAKSEYASLATVIGAQLTNMGVSSDQLAGQTDALVRKGADLAAQFGGSTADAVGALSSLLRGERDPIERYGVSINDAALKAKMAEMGLSGLTGEAEKNAKLTATLALLNQQTASSMGAFSREATTLAGAQARLSAGTENLSATFGTALLPAATAVTSALGALVNGVSTSEWFTNLTASVTAGSTAFADFVFGLLNGTASIGDIDFGGIFAGLLEGAVNGITSAANWLAEGGAAAIVNGIVSGREAVFGAALQVFPAILEALVTAIPAIVTGLVAMVTQLAAMLVTQAPIILAGAVQLFTALLTAIVTILPQLLTSILGLLPVILGALLGMIPTLLESAIQVFTALVEAIPVVLPILIAAIVDLLPKLVETLLNMIPVILDTAIELFTSLVESIPVILPLLINALIDLIPKIVSTVLGMIPRLLEAAIKLFTGLVTAIPKILPELIPALIGLLPAIIGAIIGMIPDLIRAGVDLIGGLIRGIGQMAGAVGNALINIAKGAIGGFLAFLGIKSPSRLMMKYGKNIGQGVAIGIGKSESVVSKAMDSLSGVVGNGFNATLTAPSVALVASGSSSTYGGSAPATINITVNGGLATSTDIGREVASALSDYYANGGRL